MITKPQLKEMLDGINEKYVDKWEDARVKVFLSPTGVVVVIVYTPNTPINELTIEQFIKLDYNILNKGLKLWLKTDNLEQLHKTILVWKTMK